MSSLILRAVTQLLVAVPVLAFCWTWGGMRGDLLVKVMPYATLLGLGALLIPQRRPGETVGQAFRRAWRGLFHDPLFYVGIIFLVYLCLPLFNVGRPPVGLVKLGKLVGFAYPPECYPHWRFLPFCVNPRAHMEMFCWFVPALVAVWGVRHALTRSGARFNFEFAVWNTAVLSLFGFLQIITKAQFPFWTTLARPVHFFSVFGYPNAAGSFFVLGLALSIGLWVEHMQWVEELPLRMENASLAVRTEARHPLLFAHYPVVAVALNFFAVLATFSRAAMMLAMLLVGVFVFYIVGRLFFCAGIERARRFRSFMAIGIVGLALAGIVFVYSPPQVLAELKTLNVFSISNRVSGKGEYHTRVASAMVRDYPLFGVGGWGYAYFSGLYLDKRQVSQRAEKGSANVHNDYLQFLAELGAVGFGGLSAIVWFLLAPALLHWRRMSVQAAQMARSSLSPSSIALFSLPPPVFWGLLGALAVGIHAFGDCPFRSAAVLSLLWATLATLVGYLPRPNAKLDS